MCYAIPGRLVGIEDKIGIVDYFGETRRVRIDFAEVKVGDFVYAQGGILLSRISEREAEQALDTWRQIFFELKRRDSDLSRINRTPSSQGLLEILQKVNLKKGLRKEEWRYLLALKDRNELKLLYQTANNIRQREHSNASCVHGIIEFSNYCRNDCLYCGIRNQRNMKRYRMSVEQIINVARRAVREWRFKALVLQSGEDNWYDEDKLITVVERIRKLGVLIFLSIGERDRKTYKRLFEAGARAALLRFETSNPDIFGRLRPGTSYEKRIELIQYLKDSGYILATGFLIGLPGESEEDIINNILLTKSLGPDMYSFGPFMPARGTPLETHGTVSKDILLKIIAIARMMDRQSKILITTALETLDKEAKRQGLLSGANSVMVNVTPARYRKLYSIYDDRAGQNTTVKQDIKELLSLLYSLGRAPTDLGI